MHRLLIAGAGFAAMAATVHAQTPPDANAPAPGTTRPGMASPQTNPAPVPNATPPAPTPAPDMSAQTPDATASPDDGKPQKKHKPR